MNPLWGLMILAGLIYSVWIDGTFMKIYAILITVYALFVTIKKPFK